MKLRFAIYTKTLYLFSAIVLTSHCLSASAVGQRIIQSSNAITHSMASDLQQADSRIVPDPTAPKYKLIFPTGYNIKFFRDGKKESVHPTDTDASGLVKFIEQLNEAGAEGYRFVSALGRPSMAIVKLGTVQYEYAGFDLVTQHYAGAQGFKEKYAPLAKQGYRLASQPLIRFDCLSSGTEEQNDNVVLDQGCPSYEFFIFERVKGIEKAIEFKIMFPPNGGKREFAIKETFNKRIAEGYFPTIVMSTYDVMFEQSVESSKRFADTTDIQVVVASPSYSNRDELPKKIKLLAKEGYRLAMINYQLAVMYRPGGTTRPVSYVWLEMGKRNWISRRKQRDFQQKLNKLQEAGAIYRMTYSNYLGDVNQLIFEEAAVAGGKRREYRVLKFELQAKENIAARKVQVELTPSSKDAWTEFNRLVNDRFEVRDLFVTDKACVLLERSGAGL